MNILEYNKANMLAQTNENNVGGNINMDIGNNLNIESLQDTYYAKSKSSSFGISAGGGKGKDGGANGNAGFNFGKTNSTTDSQWVSQQTSIIGDNNINIRTNNNTNLIGSVVASNSDNLSLNTGSLTYSDLNDFYREETKGYNFGTSVGGNTDKGKANMAPNGSTTIGMTHTGQEKEQITRATIGNGSIVIANNKDISDLNRDINNSQEITKDIITGALNGSMTIDNRVFTSDGRSSIANDFKNLGSNLHTLYKDITKNNIVVDSIKTALNKDNDLNIIDSVKQYIDLDKRTDNILNDKTLNKEINGETNLTPEQLEQSLKNIADKYNENGDSFNDLKIANIDGNIVGLSYTDENDSNQIISINLKNVDITNPNDLANIIAHETTNIKSHNSNENNAIARGNTASNIMDMKNYANVNTNVITSEQWLNNNKNSVILENGNNNVINNITSVNNSNNKIDFKVLHVTRDLNSDEVKDPKTLLGHVLTSAGNHSFVVSVPDHPEDFTPEKMLERGLNPDEFKFVHLGDNKISIIAGGYNDENAKNNADGKNHLITQFNNPVDVRAMRDYNSNGKSTSAGSGSLFWDFDVEVKEIKPTNGMSDTEFIYNILKNTKNYQENTKINPIKYDVLSCNSGYNCNSFSNSLIKYSGGSNYYNDFKGNDAGRNNLINNNYFMNNNLNKK